jgi:hypothetical protein
MKSSRVLLACAALLLGAAAPTRPPAGVPVTLQAQPGTQLDQVARQLVADDLQAAASRGDRPLVLIGTAKLGGDRPALFVQLQSPQECGSAGCSTSVYAFVRGAWSRVLDGTSGRLAVASTRTRGWSDLLANDERYVWTGTAYRSTRPAPSVDLRPKTPPRHSGR